MSVAFRCPPLSALRQMELQLATPLCDLCGEANCLEDASLVTIYCNRTQCERQRKPAHKLL